jgi:DNA-3-methyladenine glycosylase
MAGPRRLLSGPGNLCRGLAIGGADNGADVCGAGRVHLERRTEAISVSSGPRIGISRGADLPLRFWWTGHPAVSGRR